MFLPPFSFFSLSGVEWVGVLRLGLCRRSVLSRHSRLLYESLPPTLCVSTFLCCLLSRQRLRWRAVLCDGVLWCVCGAVAVLFFISLFTFLLPLPVVMYKIIQTVGSPFPPPLPPSPVLRHVM